MVNAKILAGIFFVVLSAGAFYFLSQKPLDGSTQETKPFLPKEPFDNLDGLLEQRNGYGIPLGVFEGLPKPPADFEKLVELMHKGAYTNYAFFPPEYFLQPEFYESFNSNTRAYWTNPSMTHYGAAGYGFYPSFQEISILPGDRITAAFFVHAGFGVQNYQGLKVVAKNNYQGTTVSVAEPEFVLGYSYPKFSNTWAKKVVVIVSSGKNALPGEYKIDFSAQAFQAGDFNSGRNFAGGGGSAGISSTILVKILKGA